jgi:hypothetical protein
MIRDPVHEHLLRTLLEIKEQEAEAVRKKLVHYLSHGMEQSQERREVKTIPDHDIKGGD